MAPPGGVSAESPGEEEDVDGEVPRKQARTELSPGEDFVVSFKGSSVELKLQYDKQGKIRIFGVGFGLQSPVTFERPGSFDMMFAQRHPERKFDLFRLSGELRNRIYSFVYPDQIGQSIPFRNTIPLYDHLMMNRLNLCVAGPCHFHTLSDDLRRETMSYILRSIRFHARGDKVAYAFLESLGPLGRAQWKGAFDIDITNWAKDAIAEAKWMPLLAECKRLREIVLVRHHDYPINYSADFFASRGDGFRRFLKYYRAKFPRLERLKTRPPVSQLIAEELLCFLKGEEYDGETYNARYKETITESLL